MTYNINLNYKIEADDQLTAIQKATSGQEKPVNVTSREMRTGPQQQRGEQNAAPTSPGK